MKKSIRSFHWCSSILFLFLLNTVSLQAQSFNWVRSDGSFILDHGNGVATDASGNAYITGAFDGRPFLRKYGPSGNLVWSRHLNNGTAGIGQAVSIDAANHIYVTGEVNNQFMVLKYNSGGTQLWSRNVGSGPGFNSGYGIAVDDNGNSVATGTANGKITIVKYNANGVQQWSKNLGQSGQYCEGRAVQIASNGEVTVAGNFVGNFSFGSGLSASSSNVDIFVFRMQANGNPRWLRTYGSNSNYESAYALTADDCDNLYVSGNFGGYISFGQAGTHNTNGNDDIFLLKLKENGTESWAKSFGSVNGFEAGFGLATDPLGNVLLVGAFSGQTSFGSGQTHSPAGSQDIFIAQYNPQGALLWMTTQGGTNLDEAKSIAVDPAGYIYIAGRYSGTSTFGPGAVLVSTCTDYFIQKFTANYDFFSAIGQGTCKNDPATLTVTGGQFWQWSNGATTSSIQVYNSGTYTVSITDGSGCVLATHSANVNISVKPRISLTPSGLSCTNLTNGQIDLSVQYGVGPLSYQWSNGATTQDLSGIGPGSYSVTVTDGNGCIAIGSTQLQAPPPLGLGLQPQNPNCSGNNNGSINSQVTGGTPPLTYAWSNGATTTGLNGLGAGTYSLTVTDANGCSQSATVTLSAPNGPVVTLSSPTFPCGTHISCNGANDGRIGIQVSGGQAPYQYSWNNGFTGTVLNNIGPGTYSVTVTDANGCVSSNSITLTEPQALVALVQGSSYGCNTGISCHGGNDGFAWVRARGGCPPYAYQWSTGHTGTRVRNLPAGSYSVTITDANGCSTGQNIILTEPSPLSSQASITSQYACGYHVTCPASADGSASVSVNGGCPPYSYQWSNGQTGALANGIGGGTHTVTITDANGCTIQDSVILAAPDPIQLNLSSSQPGCVGPATGSISMNMTGGAICRRLRIQWTGPAGFTSNGSEISNLDPGTYIVTVTDGNGCTAVDSATIAPFTSLNLSLGTQALPCGYNISCHGGNDGSSAFTTVTGGTPPYSYSWTGPNGFSYNQAMLDSVAAGSYVLTVTDANGCAVMDSVIFTEPSPLSLSLIPQNPSCTLDGNILSSVSGGTDCMGYSYNWSTGDTSQQLSNLGPGTYSLTVSDVSGCSAQASVTLTGSGGGPTANIDCCADTVLNCGDSTLIPIYFSGNGPWTFTVTDGSSPQTITTSNNPYLLSVSPEKTTTWTLLSVSEQGNSCPGEVCGSATVAVNGDCADCITIDFSRDSLGNPLPAGTILGEQWAHLGVHLSFWNAGGTPHEGIIFDSGNPTGGDWDLGTPHQDFGGPGIGPGGAAGTPGQNDTPLGNVIIIADNVIDLNNDGLVDDPNDDAAGGYMRFDFDQPMKIESLKLLDMDVGANHSIVFTFANNSTQTLAVPNLGDNSVQDWNVNVSNVIRMQFNLTTSGALAAVAACMECEEPSHEVTFNNLTNGGSCEDYRLDVACGPQGNPVALDYLDISLPCGSLSNFSNSLGLPMVAISGDSSDSGISGLRVLNIPACSTNFSITYSLCPDSSICGPAACPPILAYGQGNCIHYETAVLPGASKNTVGIAAENMDALQVKAFPNPTQGRLQVEFTHLHEQGSLRIMDLRGQVLLGQSLTNGQQNSELDLSQLATGLYLLEVKTSTERKVLRIVVE